MLRHTTRTVSRRHTNLFAHGPLRSLSSKGGRSSGGSSSGRTVTPARQGGGAAQSTAMANPRSQWPAFGAGSLGRLFEDPFSGMDLLQNDPFFRPFFGRGPGGALAVAEVAMGLDIAETDKEYVVKAELPGVSKDDVKVTFIEGMLTISAERKEEESKEDEKHTRHYSDFTYGRVSRSLRVPDAAEKDSIDAHMEHGVLTVKMKKSEAHEKETVIPIH